MVVFDGLSTLLFYLCSYTINISRLSIFFIDFSQPLVLQERILKHLTSDDQIYTTAANSGNYSSSPSYLLYCLSGFLLDRGFAGIVLTIVKNPSYAPWDQDSSY